MALHLGSRSVQLSRLVLQACRPAGIACLDIRRVLFAARASATVQTDGDCAVVERQQPANPKVGSCFGFLPARRLPASSFGNLPGGISAAHFCTFGESAAALEKGREDRDNKEQGAGRAVEQKDRGLRKPLRPCEWREEMILRGELLQCLREWSPDADLNQKLPSGTISGKPIDVTSLRAVLFSLAKAPKRDKGVDTPGEANEEAGRAPGESKYQYSEKGALQALNALEWWLSRNREDPCRSVDLLFHPVLEALSGARLTDAIAGMWDRHRMRAKENVSVFRAFLAACLRANMFEDLLTMYREAEANEWPTLTDIGDIVIKAMHAQGCSRNELWAFYKTSVEKTRLTIELPTMVTLLTSGVTVNEIRSLKYSGDWEMEKWLICALTELDRVDEARDIVREILAQERRTALPILVLVPLLEVLIQSGFRVEAQTLADQQALLDVQLHGAIYFYLKSVIQPLTGLRAYETLEAIEGSHRQSLIVQALLIKRCYEDRTLTKAMYKVYLTGKELEGDFFADTFADLIERLAEKDWVYKAEAVLSDYFAVQRKWGVHHHPLPERAFQELANMYLRYPKPQKLVGLVKNMVKQGYYVSNGLMVSWWKQLKDGDHTAEAEEMLVAREEMFQLRRKWMRDSVSGDRRGKKSGSRRGSRQGLEKHGSEGKFEGTFKKATVYGRRAHESGYANWRKKLQAL